MHACVRVRVRVRVDDVPAGGVVSASTIAKEGLQRAIERNEKSGNGTESDERIDVVLVDTSGRLHTDWRLMDELVDVKKTLKSIMPNAPQETLMVLDGTTGLNMLKQAQDFHEQVDLTGLVLTKVSSIGAHEICLGDLLLPISSNKWTLPIESLYS